MTSAARPDDLERLLERMTVAGMAPDITSMDFSEQRAVLCALRRRLALPQPHPTQDTRDEAQ